MKIIEEFCKPFDVHPFITDSIHELNGTIFRFDQEQEKLVKKLGPTVVHAGELLGWKKKNLFVPSVQFIDKYMFDAPSVTLNEQGSWLFLCGRDAFRDSIISEIPYKPFMLLKDPRGNILGYGQAQRGPVAVNNLFDKGMLLRREMTK